MKLRHCLPALGLAAGLAFSPLGEAAVLTYTTATFGVGDGPFVSPTGAFSANLLDLQLLSLPRFDAALGTLQAVEVFVQGTWTGLMQVEARDVSEEGDFIPLPPFFINNRNDASISALLETSLRFALLDPNGAVATFNLPGLTAECSDATRDAAGTTECERIGLLGVNIDQGLALGALPLSSFIGTNLLDLSMSMTGVLSGYCDDDDRGDVCSVDISSNFVGTAGVRYTYALPGGGGSGGTGGEGGGPGTAVDVPEPGTLGLLAAGLFGLALRGRWPSLVAARA
jgi:hypothetical protein